MTEKADDDTRISLEKPASSPAAPTAPSAKRPKQAVWVVTALLLAGVFALAGSLSLFALHSFIISQLTTANNKLKKSDRRTHEQLVHAAHQQPTAVLIQSVIFLVVLVVVARAVWRGRYWGRWATIGIWVLASFTGIFGGVFQIGYVFQDAPIALKTPVSLAALSFVVAVALVVVSKPLVAWLNLTRPERRTPAGTGGAAPARRGLFAPRVPAQPAGRGIDAQGESGADRARAKQRASTDAAPRSTAAARPRGSKSRRTGT